MPTEVLEKVLIHSGMNQNVSKRLLLDIDGVICEYDWTKIVWEYFGVKIKAEDIYAYNIPDILGVSQREVDIMFQEQVYGKPNLVEGALETLREWESKGYELVIFSNRVKYMRREGLTRWLVEWQIPFSRIDGGQDEYDIHIDDSPAKLMATNSEIKLLYNQPWNERCLNITGQLIRVKNWLEVREAVDREI